MKKRTPSTLAHGPEKPPAPQSSCNSPLRQALAAVSGMTHEYALMPLIPTQAMIEAIVHRHKLAPAEIVQLYRGLIETGRAD